MAKPSSLPRWATNGGRTLEPSSGEKDVGWENGTKPPARYMNWLQHLAYTWFDWFNDRFFDGATANDLEVRGVDIVTGTDADGGDLELGGGSSTGDGGSEVTFKVARAGQGAGVTVRTPAEVGKFDEDGKLTTETIEATATITNENGITGASDGSGDGVTGTGGTTGKGVVGTGGSSSGEGVDGTGGGTAGTGVKGTGGSASGVGVNGVGGGTTGKGVVGTGGSASGEGVEGTGGGTAGSGVKGTGGSASGTGVEGVGGGTTGAGVDGTGGSASGPGVKGTAGGSGYGVLGASTTGTAVRGSAAGVGTGVEGLSTAGHGVTATGDLSTPALAAFSITPQDTRPAGPNALGDMFVLTSSGLPYYCSTAGSPGVWTSFDGGSTIP